MFPYVQTRVAEIRQHYTMLQQDQTQTQPQPQQLATFGQPAQPQLVQASATDQPVPVMSQLGFSQAEQPPQQELPGPKQHIPVITQAMGYRPTVPAISAYTRLPLMSRQRRFLGSRAMNPPQPSVYQ
jgi:hypothetical protein